MGINRAFLLAAGLGTRLRPLTEKFPKPLLPVAGIPLIFYSLALLRRAKIQQVGINLHHLPKQISTLLGNGHALGFEFTYFFEESLLGTGGAIRNAKLFLQEEEFLLLNADTILDLDLSAFFSQASQHPQASHLVLSAKAPLSRFGGLQFDREYRIEDLLRASSNPKTGSSAAVYAGIALLRPHISPWLARAGATPCILRDGILPAAKQGEPSYAYLEKGYFADLGTVERWKEVENDFENLKELFSLKQEARELFGSIT